MFAFRLRLSILFLALLWLLTASAVSGQTTTRIVQPLDEAKRVTLKGNVHPLARAEFDRGAAPADLPLDRLFDAHERIEFRRDGGYDSRQRI